MVAYYRERAREYEQVYSKPERQHDLAEAAAVLQTSFAGKTVFEIACGTGYWTKQIAAKASSVFATDINDTVLEIARHKAYENNNVLFEQADFNHYQPSLKYEALFGGFIWSHIPVQELRDFLINLNRFVLTGGRVVFMDNNYVAGSSTPIHRTDEYGNTYHLRKLENGSAHLVCKNFPSESFIREQLQRIARTIQFIHLEYFWILIYEPL
jgi:demethylmenaquinone methyltransferase/2-methoxy-6-polyprenyl-1,4-benzoquinol methylase